MSSAFRYCGEAKPIAWLALFLSVLLGGGATAICLTYLSPSGSVESAPKEPVRWPSTPSFSGCDWSVFRAQDGARSATASGSLSKRFRYVGNFIVTERPSGASIRKAILDDLPAKKQPIVAEGELIDGSARVVRILEDRIVLSDGGIDEELTLSFRMGSAGTAAATNVTQIVHLMPGEKILSTNSFGVQIGETRWVMSRQRVMEYADEVREHPARMGKLFDSMKPLYAEDGAVEGQKKIAGYTVQVEGEQGFYSAVGLLDGDVVRRVNTMSMTSVQRALFWINQFRESNQNAFVLDVERGGKPVQLQYLVR